MMMSNMNILGNLNYIDTYNAFIGAVIAFFSLIFGEHWILFAIFLLFNVVDYITGWMKSKITNRINSAA